MSGWWVQHQRACVESLLPHNSGYGLEGRGLTSRGHQGLEPRPRPPCPDAPRSMPTLTPAVFPETTPRQHRSVTPTLQAALQERRAA